MINRFYAAATIVLVLSFLGQHRVLAGPRGQAEPPTATAEAFTVPTPSQLIEAINGIRISYGLPPLSVHESLMKVAQQEANGIASGMPGHWRPYGLTLGQWLIMEGYPLSGDLTLDGYRSENWNTAFSAQGVIDGLYFWLDSQDALHTETMLSTERSDIGVGIATTTDEWGQNVIYYVIETALRTNSGQQQSEAVAFLTSLPDILSGTTTINGTEVPLAEGQYMLPVAVSTAQPDGDVFHQVKYGQTLWSIAITYGTTIESIRMLNNLGPDNTVYKGQKLLVQKGATQPGPVITETPPPQATSPYRTPSPSPTTPTSPIPDSETATSSQRSSAVTVAAVILALVVLTGVFVSSLRMNKDGSS